MKAAILVIDDDELFAGAIGEMLEDAGYGVTLARDGHVGVAMFRQNQPGLVVCDIIMPNQEGIETITELRDESPDVPIIAVSGGSLKGLGSYLSSAKSLGASLCLEKPFSQQLLLDSVRELLSQRHSPRRPSEAKA